MQRENFRDLDIRVVRLDGFERTADLGGRVRFHVKCIELAGRAEVKNHDARLVFLVRRDGAERLQGGKFRKGQAKSAECADL